jgi:hypothetical protein
VVADAFVESPDEGELQSLLGIEIATPGIGDHVLDVAVVQVVEHIIELVDRLGEGGIAGTKSLGPTAHQQLGLHRHPHDEITDTIVGMGPLKTTNRLGDVGDQVTGSLDITVHVERGHDKAQIGRNRLFAYERVDAPFLDLHREQVDVVITGNQHIGRVDIALEHCRGDETNPFGDELDHVEKILFDQIEPLIEVGPDVVHVSLPWGAQPNRPVT